MQHSFDIDIAKEYGVLEAILLNNIHFWIEKNKANEVNYFDGDYWTFNSTRAYAELFPYASQRQVKNALKNLREAGILKVGNYNKLTYDRTLWYALTEKGKCIVQKCPMDCAEMSNGLCDNVQPIPDINTDDKTSYINTDSKQGIDYQKIVNMYNDICISFPKITKLSDARKKSIKARLNTYNYDDFKQLFEKAQASDFLKGKNNRDWQANFDWLIKDTNMAKTLDGNYDNKGSSRTQNNKVTISDEEKKLNDEILRMLGEI
jgi:hypothetical protein